MIGDELLTISEVATDYHVSEETIRRWIRSGRLPYEMVGPFRVRRSAVEAAAVVTPKTDGTLVVDTTQATATQIVEGIVDALVPPADPPAAVDVQANSESPDVLADVQATIDAIQRDTKYLPPASCVESGEPSKGMPKTDKPVVKLRGQSNGKPRFT